MKISVIGSGYVGLVTGTCFADNGNDVWCVDIDAKKIERLNKGEVPIFEPGLDQLIERNVASERLRFTTDLQDAVRRTRIVFLCVGTPPQADGSPDMRYVYQAAEDVARAMEEHTILVMKSTVPVGTAAEVRRRVAAVTKLPFDVVSNPEFLKEGHAIDDFLKPDRVVIGTDDPRVALIMKELYDPFVRTGNPILVMDNTSAELTKYGANALLAARISFMNELANLADRVGADINQVRQGMGSDSRIGHSFLFPGIGFGGSCLLGRETVLVRRAGQTRLVRFDRLFAELAPAASDEPTLQAVATTDLEVLSREPETGEVVWRRVSGVTRRPFEGEALEVRTKMGRRVRCTPDHPFVVSDAEHGPERVKLASQLTDEDWLPLAQGRELVADHAARLDILGVIERLGFAPAEIIVRPAQRALAGLTTARVKAALERIGEHPNPISRAQDVVRSGAMRLHEARELGLSLDGATLGTATNGTYIPTGIESDPAFWRVVGLYLAEGHCTVDGRRHRLSWSFHPTDEAALVDEVAGFWSRLGMKVDVYRAPTTMKVTVSSRLLATWWLNDLGMAADCYGQRIPDRAWELPEEHRRALLSGIWHGDSSWSRVNGGPSVVLEHGTASPELADGMLRLLGDLGVVARQKVGRTAKSTVVTHWLLVAGADQVERLLDLVKPADRDDVRASIARQTKRIAPTGSRRFEGDASAWLRITEIRRRPHQGWVYSLEVPGTETFVTTAGLVVHNCFPKDVDALGHTGKLVGMDLKLLAATNDVNRLQKRVLFDKLVARFGDLKGKRIAMWGLAFKPRTDDMREAPALTVIGLLIEAGATIHAYDPAANETARAVLGDKITYAKKQYDPLEGADALAICTEWNEFRRPDWERMKSLMKQPAIFDGRNIFDPARVEEAGFEYYGIGRGRKLPGTNEKKKKD